MNRTGTGGKQHAPINAAVSAHLSHCRWVASMDVDEFLTTRANPHLSVRQELEQSFSPEETSIHVPWLNFETDDRSRMVSSVRYGMLWRWNQTVSHSWNRFNDKPTKKTLLRQGKSITKPMFDPRHCKLIDVHGVSCPKQQRRSRYVPLAEDEIPETLLVIHHYRYVNNADIHRKCHMPGSGHAAGYHQHSPSKCEELLGQFWHPEVYDDIMLKKRSMTTTQTTQRHPVDQNKQQPT